MDKLVCDSKHQTQASKKSTFFEADVWVGGSGHVLSAMASSIQWRPAITILESSSLDTQLMWRTP